MDDYYTLLGVDADASVDDIRGAYREMKTGLDASANDSAKAKIAKLNKAWNVLSDPYQRGRYDEQRASGSDDGEANGDGSVPTTRSARPPRQPRRARPVVPPTIEPPAGTRYPVPKQRLIAMAIDLLVLLVLFIGSQFVAQAVAKSQKPEVVDRIDVLRTQVDNDTKDKSAANKVLSDAKKGTDQTAISSAQAKYDAAKKKLDDDNKAYTTEQGKLQGIFGSVIGGFFLVSFLYLVVPSIMTGKTLGKRFQRLKVMRQDGTPLRAGDAIKRYGIIVIVTFALFFTVQLGPIGAALVLVGVTTWMRNPNFQGLHDRFAKTIVVTDAE
jgi:uncharacterized RDD family membrane protein YckC